MAATADGSVPRFDDPADYARARARFADADFTGRGITTRLKVDTVPTAGVLNHPLYLWRTRGGDTLDTFIRLFLLYSAVPVEAAREALGPMPVESWVEAGLLRRADDGLVAGTVRMLPYGDLLLVTDRPPPTEAELRPDFVMSVGAATITLANATVRRPVGRTLDLGCGCGTLGLLAAEHSDEVYALDRNSRAVAYTRFNALFNGSANVRAIEGNLFEPVADMRQGFDLVVCNPPFIISPESRYLYRDSGMRGDEICRTIVRQAPEFLAEGGFCQMLCNWAHVAGEDWKQHLAGWFEGGGCDAWVMRFETTDVASYADAWARKADDSAGMLEEWMAYYRQNGIEAVSLGLVSLRRRTGPRNWVRIEDGPKPAGPIGNDVVTGFRLRDFLDGSDDRALLASRLAAAPDLRLVQRYEPRDGGWGPTESVLSREAGIPARGAADPYVATLVARCTGRRPLAELVAELAASMGRSPAEVAPPLLGVVRQLVLQGILVPAESAPVTSP